MKIKLDTLFRAMNDLEEASNQLDRNWQKPRSLVRPTNTIIKHAKALQRHSDRFLKNAAKSVADGAYELQGLIKGFKGKYDDWFDQEEYESLVEWLIEEIFDLNKIIEQVAQEMDENEKPMKTFTQFMNEATSKRVWQTPADSKGVPHEFRGYKHGGKNPIIGWFSNKHNQAAGWGIYALDQQDRAWLKLKGIPLKGIFRVATDQTTSIVKFNFKTGTVAWLDNEHLMDTDEIKFQKATAYSKVILTKDQRANRETGLKYGDVPSARLLY